MEDTLPPCWHIAVQVVIVLCLCWLQRSNLPRCEAHKQTCEQTRQSEMMADKNMSSQGIQYPACTILWFGERAAAAVQKAGNLTWHNMQEAMLPSGLHLQAKHTCEVSLGLSTLNLAVQSVAQHEREATSDNLHSPRQHTQQCCLESKGVALSSNRPTLLRMPRNHSGGYAACSHRSPEV